MSEAQRKAYELRQSGMTWQEIGDKMCRSALAARNLAERYIGKKKPGTPRQSQGAPISNSRQAIQSVAQSAGISEGELKALISSARGKIAQPKRKAMRKATGSIKALVLSDTHIGHNKFKYELFDQAVKDSKDCDIILHPGDHLEGMSGRPGHIYELDRIGYQAQMGLVRELYNQFEKPIYGIDGNHDQWYKAKNNGGVVVGEELAMSIKQYTHLGEWEGDLHIDNLWIKLFHANDGSAYANSYKGQKLVESFTGGEKPHIVFEGHYHKSLYQFVRNVHMFEAGTLCGQTGWMRGKKLAAHIGYWIITVKYNSDGVTRLQSEFVPGFE
jgi:predicted phosphodiesterase